MSLSVVALVASVTLSVGIYGVWAAWDTVVDTGVVVHSSNWNDMAVAVNGKVNRAGDTITGNLTVNGTLTAGNITTAGTVTAGTYDGGGCDVAERYAENPGKFGKLEPGDIAVLDVDNKLKIKKSESAYHNMVVGVISTDPSLTMGTKTNSITGKINEEDPPVALIGRIPTKVTDENGLIRIGDRIVSSSKPGYGMKCNEISKCQGAIVGIALENFNEKEGMIEVLIKAGF